MDALDGTILPDLNTKVDKSTIGRGLHQATKSPGKKLLKLFSSLFRYLQSAYMQYGCMSNTAKF